MSNAAERELFLGLWNVVLKVAQNISQPHFYELPTISQHHFNMPHPILDLPFEKIEIRTTLLPKPDISNLYSYVADGFSD